jgi:hypothetical protein
MGVCCILISVIRNISVLYSEKSIYSYLHIGFNFLSFVTCLFNTMTVLSSILGDFFCFSDVYTNYLYINHCNFMLICFVPCNSIYLAVFLMSNLTYGGIFNCVCVLPQDEFYSILHLCFTERATYIYFY